MKKIGKIMGLLLAVLLFSGCMKYNYNVTVNSDGSVDFKLLSAVSKQVLSYSGDSNSMKEEDYDDAKAAGFEVKKYDDGEYEGFELSKHFNSIDDVSYEDDTTVDLSMKDGKVKLFKVTKDDKKKTYKAKIDYSEAKGYSSQSDAYKDNDAYKEYLKGMEMKFVITLPTKATSNNATTVSEDGKTLTWDFLSFDKDAIEFEFDINEKETSKSGNNNNNMILYIGIGAGALVLIGVIVFIIVKGKKNNNNNDNNDDMDIEIV